MSGNYLNLLYTIPTLNNNGRVPKLVWNGEITNSIQFSLNDVTPAILLVYGDFTSYPIVISTKYVRNVNLHSLRIKQ